MKLIGAGLGRTGTKSLQTALEQLGLGPCYHMTEFLAHPEHTDGWMAAANGEQVDWKSFLRDYESTVDFPGCSFYKEMMVAFPDAKVLLSVRDPERWYDSCLDTIYAVNHKWPMSWLSPFMPKIGRISQFANKAVWQQMFEGRFLDRNFAIERFNRHTEEVIRHVPADRLLVFDVKEGWEPLCRFLGVPVPEGVPFPRLNDAAEFKARIRKIQLVQSAALVTLVTGVYLVARSLLRRVR